MTTTIRARRVYVEATEAEDVVIRVRWRPKVGVAYVLTSLEMPVVDVPGDPVTDADIVEPDEDGWSECVVAAGVLDPGSYTANVNAVREVDGRPRRLAQVELRILRA